MNKLLFTFQRNSNDDIAFVCNNVKDLEDYLNTYDWYYFRIHGDTVSIKECDGYGIEVATLEWIKQI
tara:strand:- start:292 stop:492 length:201 start_codon:yes stop_codon:yes gene_type:complete